MTSCFGKIFWGLLLVNFAFTVNDHNLSQGPGCVLLALGAAGLAPLSPKFARAAMLSWISLSWFLASVWLFDLIGTGDPMTGDGGGVYPAIQALVCCLLVWALLGGLGEYAASRGHPEFAMVASRRRVAYVVLAAVSVLWQIAVPEAHGLLVVPAAIGVVAWIGWTVMALSLINMVRRDVAYGDETLREIADRPRQYSLRTLLLMPVALWLLLLACFPKLATGDFCVVRIDKLSVLDDGQLELDYSTRASSGTTLLDESLPGSGGGSSCGAGFPALPGRGRSRSRFTINPDRIAMTTQEIRSHMLVEQGRTYRVVPGKWLYLYDYKSKDGTRYCYRLTVTPGSRLGL